MGNQMSSISINWNAFTPYAAMAGGAMIGLSASLYIFLLGRIAGISGVVNSVCKGNSDDGIKSGFLAGLLSTGLAASVLFPSKLTYPQFDGANTLAYSAGVLVVGGFLTGAGVTLQHGCTSGHGVVGLSRMSPKSLVATLTFMAAGVTMGSFLKPLLVPALDSLLPSSLIGPSLYNSTVAAAAAVAVTGLLVANTLKTRKDMTRPAVASACGALFGAGLIVSQMTSPAKVSNFLNVFSPGGWDPSLMFVMCGAIGVGLVPFQYAQSLGSQKEKTDKANPTPVIDKTTTFSEMGYLQPASWSSFDRKASTLVGGTLFGFGWSLAGACPGPALVNAAAGASPVAFLWVPAFLCGMTLANLHH